MDGVCARARVRERVCVCVPGKNCKPTLKVSGASSAARARTRIITWSLHAHILCKKKKRERAFAPVCSVSFVLGKVCSSSMISPLPDLLPYLPHPPPPHFHHQKPNIIKKDGHAQVMETEKDGQKETFRVRHGVVPCARSEPQKVYYYYYCYCCCCCYY